MRLYKCNTHKSVVHTDHTFYLIRQPQYDKRRNSGHGQRVCRRHSKIYVRKGLLEGNQPDFGMHMWTFEVKKQFWAEICGAKNLQKCTSQQGMRMMMLYMPI